MYLDSKTEEEEKSVRTNTKSMPVKEANMNNLDMYSREKVNKIHLDEMHQDAKDRLILRNAEQERDPKGIAVYQRRSLALALSALIAAIGSFLHPSHLR
jgi:hypothetical protein